MPREQAETAEARALLNEVLDNIENWPSLTDLNQADRTLHDKQFDILREIVGNFLECDNNPSKVSHAILNLARAIYSAHIIGTFKTPATPPSRQGGGRSVIDALLQATTKRPTAEFVSRLQEFDPDFRTKILASRAENMRTSKATRLVQRERALLEAIHAEMTTVPCERPFKEATAIRDAVNRRLTAAGYEPVSVHVIRRRIEKDLRS